MPSKKTRQRKGKKPSDREEGAGKETKSDTLDSNQALLQALLGYAPGAAPATKSHLFWDSQPVPKSDEVVSDHGPIEVKTLEDVRDTPLPLHEAYEWITIDMTDEATVREVYKLLNENYVEDDDNMFRFDYSPEFLKWALMAPGYIKEWHCGIRVKKNKKLVAFITGIPVRACVYDKYVNVYAANANVARVVEVAEINFLCVHKKLRNKRLAPVLIKEITRRVNITDRWQAVYTAGVVLPKPVSKTRYWHRSLNPRKLISIGFSHLPPNLTLSATIKLYKVPKEPQVQGIRPMEPADVPQACELLRNFLAKYKLHVQFDEDEFAHWLLPRENVINSYVVESLDTGDITDMVSFYTLPSSVIGHHEYNHLKAAYCFYNVSTHTPWNALMNDALIFAKQLGFDVFNALDVMENEEFLKRLKFGVGDGNLQYYMYNWKCPEIAPKDLGLVLL